MARKKSRSDNTIVKVCDGYRVPVSSVFMRCGPGSKAQKAQQDIIYKLHVEKFVPLNQLATIFDIDDRTASEYKMKAEKRLAAAA